MPEKKVIREHFLSKEKVIALEETFLRHGTSFLVYSGEKLGDFVYYRPSCFSAEGNDYIRSFEPLSRAPFVELDQMSDLSQSHVPMLKAFGTFEEMQAIYADLEGDSSIAPTLVHDPFSKRGGFYLLVNSADATKGGILEDLIRIDTEKERQKPFVIAAGDGGNDVSMFKVADVAIAMGTATDAVKAQADIITGAARDEALVETLEEVIAQHGK